MVYFVGLTQTTIFHFFQFIFKVYICTFDSCQNKNAGWNSSRDYVQAKDASYIVSNFRNENT